MTENERSADVSSTSNPTEASTDDAAYARDMGPVSGRDEEQPNIAGSDESGYAAPVAPPVVAGAPSNLLGIDEGADQSGRGADGDTDARLAQKTESAS